MSDDAFDPFRFADAMFEGPSSDPLAPEQAESLRQHFFELAAEHRISWEERDIHVLDAEGLFSPETREITVPIIRSELGYFVALHEVGHVALELPSFEHRPEWSRAHRLYRNEAIVWEWTLDAAVIPPSQDACEKLVAFLRSDDPGEGLVEAIARVRRKCAARAADAPGEGRA